jgi:putative urate catabolism protein
MPAACNIRRRSGDPEMTDQRPITPLPYPRDLSGYGREPPDPKWPGNAAIAVQFVLNYEEGGEYNILDGDPHAESFLAEHLSGPPRQGVRHGTVESIFEYGSRVGFWRIWRLFAGRGLPLTVYGVALALARNPDAVAAMQESRWEIASHGLRWIDHQHMSEAEERAYIDATIALHTKVCGGPPEGWYMGRCSVNSTRLLSERGFAYLADSYSDELPYWIEKPGGHQLVVPYTLDANDMRFLTPQGFATSEDFFVYLRDTFDVLYRDGLEGRPRMMSIGLHNRIAGRPGRIVAVERFMDHLARFDRVWTTTRLEVARHWHAHMPPPTR